MMKSTPEKREFLYNRLKSALDENPDSQDLRDALDVVEDILKYHRQLVKKRAVYVLHDRDLNTMYFYNPVNMELLGKKELDGRYYDIEDKLGDTLKGFL